MEESATDEAVGMQRGYEEIGAWSTATRGGRRIAKDDCLCRVQYEKTTLQADMQTKYKLQMAQSITDATSTGENGGMLWNNSMFCNELINYAVRIV